MFSHRLRMRKSSRWLVHDVISGPTAYTPCEPLGPIVVRVPGVASFGESIVPGLCLFWGRRTKCGSRSPASDVMRMHIGPSGLCWQAWEGVVWEPQLGEVGPLCPTIEGLGENVVYVYRINCLSSPVTCLNIII